MAWPRMFGGAGVNITLYRIGKRINSTLLPTSDDSPIVYSCRMNDGESTILNPVLKLSAVSAETNLINRNYVYIPQFGRYYWIDDWRYDSDGCWSAYCSEDYLASWKTAIWNSGGYVNRSSGKANHNIIDSMYPAENFYLYNNILSHIGLTPDPASGAYIIGVISDQNTNVGAISYYLVNHSNLQTLISNMVGFTSLSNIDFSTITSMTSDVLKSLVNPIQYITSCKWFPFPASVVTSTTHNQALSNVDIYVFGWKSGAVGKKIIDTQNSIGNYILVSDIADIPVAKRGGEIYINADRYPYVAPYAEYCLITPWGTFDLDSSIMAKLYAQSATYRKIEYELIVDFVSGQAIFRCWCIPYADIVNNVNRGITYEFFRRDINLAFDIPLAQATIDYLSIAHSALGAVGDLGNKMGWVTNKVGTAVSLAGHTIDAVAAAKSPSVSTTTNSSAAFTSEINNIWFQFRRYRTFPQSRDTLGSPLEQYESPISGCIKVEDGITYNYVQLATSEFHAAGCKQSEIDAIKQALFNGIYLE